MFGDEPTEQSQAGVQLGWITGFTWNKVQILDYREYREVLHGAIPNGLVPIIFRKLKTSSSFPEHLWVDVFRLIEMILFILAFALLAVGLAK